MQEGQGNTASLLGRLYADKLNPRAKANRNFSFVVDDDFAFKKLATDGSSGTKNYRNAPINFKPLQADSSILKDTNRYNPEIHRRTENITPRANTTSYNVKTTEKSRSRLNQTTSKARIVPKKQKVVRKTPKFKSLEILDILEMDDEVQTKKKPRKPFSLDAEDEAIMKIKLPNPEKSKSLSRTRNVKLINKPAVTREKRSKELPQPRKRPKRMISMAAHSKSRSSWDDNLDMSDIDEDPVQDDDELDFSSPIRLTQKPNKRESIDAQKKSKTQSKTFEAEPEPDYNFYEADYGADLEYGYDEPDFNPTAEPADDFNGNNMYHETHHVDTSYVPLRDADESVAADLSMDSLSHARAKARNKTTRFSSIGNDLLHEPHHDIPAKEVARYLDLSLPEDKRFHQLFVWAAKKAARHKKMNTNSKSQSIIESIQKSFLTNLTNGNTKLDWGSSSLYSQKDKGINSSLNEPISIEPNFENQKNLKKKADLEERLRQLQKDQRALKNIEEENLKICNLKFNDLKVEETDELKNIKASETSFIESSRAVLDIVNQISESMEFLKSAVHKSKSTIAATKILADDLSINTASMFRQSIETDYEGNRLDPDDLMKSLTSLAFMEEYETNDE